MCSVVKQQATGSRAATFFISLTLANISLPLLRRTRELHRVVQVPFFGPSSVSQHSLHELILKKIKKIKNSHFELLTFSLKLLFIFATSIPVVPCPVWGNLQAALGIRKVRLQNSTRFILKKWNPLTFLFIRAEMSPLILSRSYAEPVILLLTP